MSTDDVRKLTPDQKRALLVALIRDLAPGGPLILDDDITVYRPVPNARELAEQSWRNATPEELAESARRAATPEDSVSFEEMMRLIDADEDRDE